MDMTVFFAGKIVEKNPEKFKLMIFECGENRARLDVNAIFFDEYLAIDYIKNNSETGYVRGGLNLDHELPDDFHIVRSEDLK